MIEATAPGKIILFGEHAVVYGRPAIAVPVAQVQARVVLHPADRGAGLRIIAPDLGQDYHLTDAPAHDPLATLIQATLSHFQEVAPPDAILHLSSTIPLGRGLGSGAAISTAIVRALAQLLSHPLTSADVSALVYEVEKLYHGTPSGIDNTVVAFEQPVYFMKGRPIQRMRVHHPLTLVVGDTGIAAPTHTVVGDLRRRWQAEPDRYEGYFDEVGVIVNQARVAIEEGRLGLMAVGELMNENQELLESLRVSSPKLDCLIGAAREAGALGAKMSGAGWGGNMIALTEPESAAGVGEALSQAGAVKVIITEVAKSL